MKLGQAASQESQGHPVVRRKHVTNTCDLTGWTAIVTGAAKGIGRAIAEILVINGCEVLIWYANAADMPGAKSVQIDITRQDQVARAGWNLPGQTHRFEDMFASHTARYSGTFEIGHAA